MIWKVSSHFSQRARRAIKYARTNARTHARTSMNVFLNPQRSGAQNNHSPSHRIKVLVNDGPKIILGTEGCETIQDFVQKRLCDVPMLREREIKIFLPGGFELLGNSPIDIVARDEEIYIKVVTDEDDEGEEISFGGEGKKNRTLTESSQDEDKDSDSESGDEEGAPILKTPSKMSSKLLIARKAMNVKKKTSKPTKDPQVQRKVTKVNRRIEQQPLIQSKQAAETREKRCKQRANRNQSSKRGKEKAEVNRALNDLEKYINDLACSNNFFPKSQWSACITPSSITYISPALKVFRSKVAVARELGLLE